jgi:hypothetical protein
MLGTWGSVGGYIASQLPNELDSSASDRHIWQMCAYVAAALTGILLIFTFTFFIIRCIKVFIIVYSWLSISLSSLCLRRLRRDTQDYGNLHAYISCSSFE